MPPFEHRRRREQSLLRRVHANGGNDPDLLDPSANFLVRHFPPSVRAPVTLARDHYDILSFGFTKKGESA